MFSASALQRGILPPETVKTGSVYWGVTTSINALAENMAAS